MSVQNVSPETVKQWLDSGQAVLMDVREKGEYTAEHIEGSVLVPLSTLNPDDIMLNPTKKTVIHCLSGKRGSEACSTINTAFPDAILYHLEGGLTAWINAGLPVVRSGKAFLPLDRQVQLAIGLLLVFFCTLGIFVSASFFVFTAFIGCGLVLAGLTGFCGLAKVMARMPWNQK